MDISSNPNTTTPTAIGARNLLQTAAANASYKTFGKAVEAAGMTDTLSGIGPFTVFAPTDAAFNRLPGGKLDGLLKPEHKEELATLLKGHVINGRKSAADIGLWKSVKTFNGQSSPIVMTDGSPSIDGANVTEPDMSSSNGMLHGIDKVLLPVASATKQ